MGAEHEHIHNDHEHHDHEHHDHEHHDHQHDHGHEGHDHGSGVEVHWGHKSAALCIMAVATLICSLAPIYVRKKIYKKSNSKRREIVLSGLLCLGAGVLLAAVFLHLLPETRNNISKAMNKGFINKTEFPIAEILLCCGFFLIYLIEDMVHKCVGHSHNNEEATVITNISTVEGGMYRKNSGKITEKSVPNGIDNKGFQGDLDHESNQPPTSYNDVSSQPTLMKGADTSVLNAVIVVVAISFHSVMEGLAIGLEESVLDMWLLCGVLSIHKLIIAFSIGMELLQEGVKLVPFLAAMITFSLASPIGGIIGSFALSWKDDSALGMMVPTVLEGLAGGCIVFIIFCEILERERTRKSGSFIRIFALMVGFGLMCGLEVIPGHSH